MIPALLLWFGVATAGADQPVWEASITLPAEAAGAYGLAIDTLSGDDPAQAKVLAGLVGHYSVHLDRIDIVDAANVAMPRGFNIYASGHILWFETRGTLPYRLRVGPKSARGDRDDRPSPPLAALIEQIREQRGAMISARGNTLNTNDLPNLILPMAQVGTLHQTGSVVEAPPPNPNVELHTDTVLVLGIAAAAVLALVLLAALDARLRWKRET